MSESMPKMSRNHVRVLNKNLTRKITCSHVLMSIPWLAEELCQAKRATQLLPLNTAVFETPFPADFHHFPSSPTFVQVERKPYLGRPELLS